MILERAMFELLSRTLRALLSVLASPAAPVRPLHTGPMQTAPDIAASRVKYTWGSRIFGFVFVFLCTLALMAVIAVAVNL